MRLNRYIASATGLSRRAADKAIIAGRVTVNDEKVSLGTDVSSHDRVELDGAQIVLKERMTIMLNKPVGYVCSRTGQGSKTVYDLLPKNLHHLKPVGRLDKDSSGLLLLTNDGELADKLTHPRYQKEKVYDVKLDKALDINDQKRISGGVRLEDGISKFNELFRISDLEFRISISEGRNRQIRRTFNSVGYSVRALKRTQFGPFSLAGLSEGKWRRIDSLKDSVSGNHL